MRLLLAFLLLAPAAGAQAFLPDLTFGAAPNAAGLVLTSLPDGEFHAAVTQPDGKIVASGSGFTVARVLPTGAFDPSFGTQGVATAPFGSDSRDARTLVLQPDGALLAAGWAGGCGRTYCPALARFTPDGQPDASFGTGGTVRIPATQDQILMGIVVQPDGRIVVGGFSVLEGELVIARILGNGQLDSTFGTSGVVRLTPDVNAAAYSLRLQPDGKILFAGNGNGDVLVVRLNPDGSRDATFGVFGVAHVNLGAQDFGYSLAVLPSGKLVVAGRTSGFNGDDVSLVRLTAAGALDPTFGTGGIVRTDFGSGTENARALVAQPDGRLVVTGPTGQGGQQKAFVARYLDDGRLDVTFGTAGRTFTAFSPADDGRGLTLAGDGVVVAGSSLQQGWRKAALFGFTTSGSLNAAFTSTRGALRRLSDGAYRQLVTPALAVTSQGRAVLGGYAFGASLDLLVAQFEPDGLPAAGGHNGLTFTDRRASEGLLAITTTPTSGYAATGFSGEASQDVLFVTSTGVVTAADLGGEDVGAAIVRDSSNAYVVGATTTGGIALVRFSPQGQRLDTRTYPVGSVAAGVNVTDLARLPDGRLLLLGTQGNDGFVLRTLSNLAPDPTFGHNGVVYLTSPTEGVTARGLVALPDGRIGVGGYATTLSTGIDTPFLAMLTAEGTLDTSFGPAGLRRYTLPAPARINDLVRLRDGSYVAAGLTYGTTRDGLLLHVAADGTLLETDGLQVDQGGTDAFLALALDASDRLYVVGTSDNDATLSRYTVRLTTALAPVEVTPGLTLTVAPNPTRGAFGVTVSMGAPGPLALRLYDLLGRVVAVLYDGVATSTVQNLSLSPTDLSPGTYVLRLETPSGRTSRLLVITR